MSAPTNLQPTAPWRLLEGYRSVEGVYDEMLDAGGAVRPHCERFIRAFEALDRHEFASRWENAKRAVRDNGVTYNVYGDPQGTDRPWVLDPIPLLMSPLEWRRIEDGIVQRTRLLNLILADIYGAQRLLRKKLLPPALVLANPAFLRPCRHLRVPLGVHLHLHAVDLARSPEGRWWALADRTQSPSGVGYALENRIALSRSFPEAFRDCQAERLASFFRAHRDTLASHASTRRHSATVVLLTPGPHNETYFEHAYLARYLGFTLVEGSDLTVRERRVFIKTLEGLEPVDVVFRRLDDAFCDPLELQGHSSLGVPGLLEAARAGNVTIANALGSGVVETAALMAFLPSLCRELLGEDLILPSVATWWCGEPNALAYVLEHLDHLVIKRAFKTRNQEPVFCDRLSEAARRSLAAEIQANPEEFVGQEEVALSTAPVWSGQTLEPRPVVLRTYITAAGDSYLVMPGGLTRAAGGRDVPIVSMQRGGASKDTWILSDRPVNRVTLLASPQRELRGERRTTDLPSRVADNLFWLGRHAERAEHGLRLLRSFIVRLTQEDAGDDASELRALLKILLKLELLPRTLGRDLPIGQIEREALAFLVRHPPESGLRKTLNQLHRIASIVRDRLSMDTWRILNQLHQDFRLRQGSTQSNTVLVHLNQMITDLAAFAGMEMENMTRGHGWRFLDVGRRLERSIDLTKVVTFGLTLGSPENAVLEPLLEVADSVMTYRRRYFERPQLPYVLDLLLADATNTRALAFQLDALALHAHNLPRDPRAPSPTREEKLVASAIAALRNADLGAVGRPAMELPAVVALLASIEGDVRAFSDAITYFYFTHAEQRIN